MVSDHSGRRPLPCGRHGLDRYGDPLSCWKTGDSEKNRHCRNPEVERVIYELPAVLEEAVVGIPHPKWLEVPKEIEFIDQLPRNPSGKVLKRELRAAHNEGPEERRIDKIFAEETCYDET